MQFYTKWSVTHDLFAQKKFHWYFLTLTDLWFDVSVGTTFICEYPPPASGSKSKSGPYHSVTIKDTSIFPVFSTFYERLSQLSLITWFLITSVYVMQHIKGGTLLSAQIVMSYAICKLNSLSVCDFTKYLLNEIHFSCKIYHGYETKNIFSNAKSPKLKVWMKWKIRQMVCSPSSSEDSRK